MAGSDAQTNATIADQLSYKDKLPQGIPYLENNGFMVMGETDEGMDIHFVSCIFRVGGGKNNVWQVEDAFKVQTTFLVTPGGASDTMRDNDFIGNRTWATDAWGPASIVQTADAVTWRLGNREHICRPPYWEIHGEHMGVECDLVLSGIGDVSYHKGKFAEMAANGIAGYEAPLVVEGTIKANGKTHTLNKSKSFGCQEKFIQPGFDLAKVLRGETYYWVWWANERVRIFIYTYPSMGRYYSNVTVDGHEIPFSTNGRSDMKMEEVEYWIDPKTRLRVPVKWHFNMKSPNGNIDLDISASARTFYSYLTESGATMHYGLHSHSVGNLTYPDGRVLPLTGLRSYVEHGWCAIPLVAGT